MGIRKSLVAFDRELDQDYLAPLRTQSRHWIWYEGKAGDLGIINDLFSSNTTNTPVIPPVFASQRNRDRPGHCGETKEFVVRAERGLRGNGVWALQHLSLIGPRAQEGLELLLLISQPFRF
jgi:hypothetical protein